MWSVLLLLLCFLETTVALQSSLTPSSASSSSLLVDTKWKLQLDVGLQPGTWMPKRFPGWAESGARLGLGVEVQFTNKASSTSESLVGPLAETFELAVTSPPAKFVSAKGEETVEFTAGGWCIQRPTADVRNAQGSLVKPEGLLRFWLDCPTGAKRQDVEIFPRTRIFFTTGVWDDPQAVEQQRVEYDKVVEEIEAIKQRTVENREKSQKENPLEYLSTFTKLFGDSRSFDQLNERRQQYERALPPYSSSKGSNGVLLAPSGSLVIKGNQTPDWMPGSEYLILGTFATSMAD